MSRTDKSVLPLAPGHLHIWYTPTAGVPADCLPKLRRLLPPDELQRCDRFVMEGDRKDHLVARAHLRTVLSRYASTAPREWQFRTSAAGKPRIASLSGAEDLHFSLSHTRGMVASLVSRIAESGIDVENVSRESDFAAISGLSFAAGEIRALERLSGAESKSRFFELWTLKEAYSKARGIGLDLDFRKVAFYLERERIAVSFAADLEDSPESWHFALIRPTPEHQVAFAVKVPAGQRISTEIRCWQPGKAVS